MNLKIIKIINDFKDKKKFNLFICKNKYFLFYMEKKKNRKQL